MMKRQYKTILFSLVLIFILISGCSGRPSDENIKKIVSEYMLEHAFEVTNPGALCKSKTANIEDIRLIQVGETQRVQSQKYWPVKIYASGTCTCMGGVEYAFGKDCRFTTEDEYNIFKDPYGKWIAKRP